MTKYEQLQLRLRAINAKQRELLKTEPQLTHEEYQAALTKIIESTDEVIAEFDNSTPEQLYDAS